MMVLLSKQMNQRYAINVTQYNMIHDYIYI